MNEEKKIQEIKFPLVFLDLFSQKVFEAILNRDHLIKDVKKTQSNYSRIFF